MILELEKNIPRNVQIPLENQVLVRYVYLRQWYDNI